MGPNPLKSKPITAIWDPHFGQSAIKTFTRGGVSYPVNVATSGVYHWWYTIGMRSNTDLYFGALGLLGYLVHFYLQDGYIYNLSSVLG